MDNQTGSRDAIVLIEPSNMDKACSIHDPG